MIDVPVAVKDALREGTYKKNYRFKVLDLPSEDGEYVDIVSGWDGGGSEASGLTLSSVGKYKVYSSTPYFTLMLRSGTTYGGVRATDRDPVTGDYYVECEFTYAPSTIWVSSPSGSYNVGIFTTYDYTIIDNNNLISESVSIDERMCSGDTLKFGLCEGSSLEFQYFDKPNITGKRVQAFVDVLYELSKWQKKAVLESVFLENYECLEDGLYKIFISAEEASKISYAQRKHGSTVGRKDFVLFSDGHKECEIECNEGDKLYIIPYSSANIGQGEIFLYNSEKWHSIPMGFFDVKKCSRQASTGIIKATCYNKLQSEYLDAKANEKVLKQFDDENSSVLVYDLKRLLLEDYEIEQAEIVDITESYRGYFIELDDATTTKYDSAWLVGDRGPFGPANVAPTYPPTAVNTAVKFYFATNAFAWDMDPTKYYRIDSAYDLDTLERSFYEYVEQIITWVYFPAATEAQYMSNLVQNSWGSIPDTQARTWKNIFAIILVKNDNTEEWYSTIGKQYGMNVAGTMSDLAKKTFTGYKQMWLWVPECAGCYYYSGSSGSFHKICDFFGNDFQYYYWEDVGVELGTNTFASFKFPDGSIIPESLRPTQFMNVLNVESLSDAEKVEVQINALPDYTLRDLTTASYETTCTFGQLSRTTDLFSGVELNHSRLYPADSLYPATDLYPDGAAVSGFKSMYSKLWADEGNIHKWRYLIITYKGLDGEGNETDYTLQRTVNADGTDNYNMSDNWLFRNLVWTAEQVAEYAEAMVAKMQDMTWFPFEMWCAGLPYLETGDEIEIPLGEETYTSYILQRQLKGIQNLQDTYINGTLDIF